MKKLTLVATVIVAILFASTPLLAQEKKMEKKDGMMEKKDGMMEKKDMGDKMMSMTWKGFLVDKMCGSGMAKKAKDEAMSKAMKHTVSCALEEGCMESGYGLLIDGKYHKFDEAGDKMAVDYLKKATFKDNILVEVSGSHEGEIIKVKSIAAGMMEKVMEKMMEKKMDDKKMDGKKN